MLPGLNKYTRFYTAADRDVDLIESLKARKFTPLTASSEADESIGWVPFEAPFDEGREFSDDNVRFGSRVVVSVRRDQIKVPKALLKREAQKRIKLMIEDGTLSSIHDVGRALMKTIEASCAVQLRARLIPKTKIVPVILDGEVLRVFSRGTFVVETIASLIERTFGLRVMAATPEVNAAALTVLDPVPLDRLISSSLFGISTVVRSTDDDDDE